MSTDYSYSYDTETIEHKTGIPLPLELARDIAAFANTKGGKIIIGYIPTVAGLINFKGLTDTQISAAKASTEAALLLLHPKPLISVTEDTPVEDKKNLIVSVQKCPTPVLFVEGDRYYIRQGSTTTLAEEELIDALSDVVPSIKPNILNLMLPHEPVAEKSLDERYPDLAAEWHPKPKSFTQIIEETIEEKPQLDLTSLLSESIKRTREDLTTQRNEQLQQARITFIIAITVLVLAIILVFVGVILIFTSKIQAGVVSSAASIVSGIVSGLALAFNKQTNDRLDEYVRELVALEKSYTGMQYIFHITDVRMKDEAIRDLAKSIAQGNQTNK